MLGHVLQAPCPPERRPSGRRTWTGQGGCPRDIREFMCRSAKNRRAGRQLSVTGLKGDLTFFATSQKRERRSATAGGYSRRTSDGRRGASIRATEARKR